VEVVDAAIMIRRGNGKVAENVHILEKWGEKSCLGR
jgi:hypothetical protein